MSAPTTPLVLCERVHDHPQQQRLRRVSVAHTIGGHHARACLLRETLRPPRPEVVLSIEDRARAHDKNKAAKRVSKLAAKEGKPV